MLEHGCTRWATARDFGIDAAARALSRAVPVHEFSYKKQLFLEPCVAPNFANESALNPTIF